MIKWLRNNKQTNKTMHTKFGLLYWIGTLKIDGSCSQADNNLYWNLPWTILIAILVTNKWSMFEILLHEYHDLWVLKFFKHLSTSFVPI